MTRQRHLFIAAAVAAAGLFAPAAAHAEVAPLPAQAALKDTVQAQTMSGLVGELEALTQQVTCKKNKKTGQQVCKKKRIASDLYDDYSENLGAYADELGDVIDDRASEREEAADTFFTDREEAATTGPNGFETVYDAQVDAIELNYETTMDALDEKLDTDKTNAEAYAEALADPNNAAARQSLVAYCNSQMGARPASVNDPKKPTKGKKESAAAYAKRVSAYTKAKKAADDKQAREKEWMSDRADCLDGAQADAADEWLDNMYDTLDNNYDAAEELADKNRETALDGAEKTRDDAEKAFDRKQAKDEKETERKLDQLETAEAKFAADLEKRGDRALTKLTD